jgi:hypothetical protein
MALELHTTNSSKSKLTKEEQEKFRFLAEHVWQTPWWREFIDRKIRPQRDADMDKLLNGIDGRGGGLDQRTEDRLRGEISALNLILNVDEFCRQQHDLKHITQEQKLKEINQNGSDDF